MYLGLVLTATPRGIWIPYGRPRAYRFHWTQITLKAYYHEHHSSTSWTRNGALQRLLPPRFGFGTRQRTSVRSHRD